MNQRHLINQIDMQFLFEDSFFTPVLQDFLVIETSSYPWKVGLVFLFPQIWSNTMIGGKPTTWSWKSYIDLKGPGQVA